jgi:MtrB/PioB family decaheme-associated outer membrane protein
MRTRTMILIGAALLVTSARYAQAQDTKPAPAQAQTATTSFTPNLGLIDFGYRGTSFTGDEARYNRYRDLRDGPTINKFRLVKENETSAFRGEASNVGYRDQRYYGDFQNVGKFRGTFEFTSNPLYQAKATGFFNGVGTSTLTINDAAQTAMQTSNANAEAALASYGSNYDIAGRRDLANLNMTYTASRDLDVKVQLRNTRRDGTNLQDFGFGNSPGNMMVLDMPVPVNDRTTDLRSRLEWANQQGLLAIGYDASWYDQHNAAFTFDNPLRVSDSATAGPAFGRAALMPSNSVNTFNVSSAYKLAGHSKVTAAFSYSVMDQNESLLPNTTNTALVGVAALPRASAEAKVDVFSTVVGYNTRPIKDLWLNAKFRYYDYNNKTESFTNTVVPGDFGIGVNETSEPTAFNRRFLDLDATYSPLKYVDFGAGYAYEGYSNHLANESVQGRIYSDTGENAFRLTADSTGNQYVTARVKYEHANRTASGFEEEILTELGEQPGIRHYDVAPRDRNRVTGTFTVTPKPVFDVSASIFYGHDSYPETVYGLQDNKNQGWTLGFDLVPNAMVNFGLSYGQEKYDTFQASRTSNPAPDPTFTDPRRDWNNTINDKTNTFSTSLNLVKAIKRTDIRFSYDISDGATNYTYGLVANTTLTAPVQYLTQPTNRLDVSRVDVNYFVRANVSLGAAYWYEQWKVQDFALDPGIINTLIVRNPTSNALTGFYTGYANEPYKANTFFVKMSYLW